MKLFHNAVGGTWDATIRSRRASFVSRRDTLAFEPKVGQTTRFQQTSETNKSTTKQFPTFLKQFSTTLVKPQEIKFYSKKLYEQTNFKQQNILQKVQSALKQMSLFLDLHSCSSHWRVGNFQQFSVSIPRFPCDYVLLLILCKRCWTNWLSRDLGSLKCWMRRSWFCCQQSWWLLFLGWTGADRSWVTAACFVRATGLSSLGTVADCLLSKLLMTNF